MKLNEIQDLIKFVSKSGVSEVELETKEIKIVIKTTNAKPAAQAPVVYQQAMPVAQAPVAVQAAPAAETKAPEAKPAADTSANLITIKSPMIGTF
ncbi:MAG: acetyl-CoA carboxylase biotin carboxyl carrier protein, partial [Bacteroidia bacterium]